MKGSSSSWGGAIIMWVVVCKTTNHLYVLVNNIFTQMASKAFPIIESLDELTSLLTPLDMWWIDYRLY